MTNATSRTSERIFEEFRRDFVIWTDIPGISGVVKTGSPPRASSARGIGLCLPGTRSKKLDGAEVVQALLRLHQGTHFASPVTSDPRAPHVGAGGASSWAISVESDWLIVRLSAERVFPSCMTSPNGHVAGAQPGLEGLRPR